MYVSAWFAFAICQKSLLMLKVVSLLICQHILRFAKVAELCFC